MTQHVDELLDRIGIIRHARDLDLALFCSRHRHALLTAEQLAAFVGYELQHVTATLDTMIDAGALKRTHNRTHDRALYVFGPGPILETPLATLLQIASSRPGRLEILQTLKSRPPLAASRKA